MRSIVTGGAGFIGSHLVDLLVDQGHEVIVLDNLSTGSKDNIKHHENKIQFLDCDISDNGVMDSQIQPGDHVFHLAALADIVPSIQHPESYYKANVLGTLNVAQAARRNKAARVIYAASSSCYGIPAEYPTPETSGISPQYPYALTKRLGEEIMLHWCKVYDVPTISLRFFNVYGPRARTSGTYGAVLGVFLAQKLANQPLTIVGDGTQTRDFTYVTDIATALISAAQSNISKDVFNVGSGETISINEMAKLISNNHVFIPKRPGEPDCTFADIKKIKAKLNWQPTIKISEGIAKTLEHIDYWSKAPVWTPDSIHEATKDWFKYLGKTDS